MFLDLLKKLAVELLAKRRITSRGGSERCWRQKIVLTSIFHISGKSKKASFFAKQDPWIKAA
jgi:hypothetical protein